MEPICLSIGTRFIRCGHQGMSDSNENQQTHLHLFLAMSRVAAKRERGRI